MFDLLKNVWTPERAVQETDLEALLKGEEEGHPFRGNQWTEGGEGGGGEKKPSEDKGPKETGSQMYSGFLNSSGSLQWDESKVIAAGMGITLTRGEGGKTTTIGRTKKDIDNVVSTFKDKGWTHEYKTKDGSEHGFSKGSMKAIVWKENVKIGGSGMSMSKK